MMMLVQATVTIVSIMYRIVYSHMKHTAIISRSPHVKLWVVLLTQNSEVKRASLIHLINSRMSFQIPPMKENLPPSKAAYTELQLTLEESWPYIAECLPKLLTIGLSFTLLSCTGVWAFLQKIPVSVRRRGANNFYDYTGTFLLLPVQVAFCTCFFHRIST